MLNQQKRFHSCIDPYVITWIRHDFNALPWHGSVFLTGSGISETQTTITERSTSGMRTMCWLSKGLCNCAKLLSHFQEDVFCQLMHITSTSCRLLQGGIHLVQGGLFLRKLLFSIHPKRYLMFIALPCSMAVLGLFLHTLISWYLLVDQEFKDTLKYIESIRSTAEPYGICRIVPPPSWKPPCLLKEKNIWECSKFCTRVQKVDKLQNRKSSKKGRRGGMMKKRRKLLELEDNNNINHNQTGVQQNQERFGFEPGPEFTLQTFKKYADDTVLLSSR